MKNKLKQCKLFLPKYSELVEENKNELKAKAPEDIEVKIQNQKINNGFKRNQWLRIQCGKKVIYRVVRGATATGLTSEKIWLSYDSRIELGAESGSEIIISPCSTWERIVSAPMNSPDPFMKAQFYFSVVISVAGIVIGSLGVMLAVASFFCS